MNTVAMNRTMAVNHTNINKKASLADRFKKYILDNAEYFAAASVAMTGNGYAGAQIMLNARRCAADNK